MSDPTPILDIYGRKGNDFSNDHRRLKDKAADSRKAIELAAVNAPLIPRLAEILERTINCFDQISLMARDHYANDMDFLVNNYTLGEDFSQLTEEWNRSLLEIKETWTAGAQSADETQTRAATKNLIELKKIIQIVTNTGQAQRNFAKNHWGSLRYRERGVRFDIAPPWNKESNDLGRAD